MIALASKNKNKKAQSKMRFLPRHVSWRFQKHRMNLSTATLQCLTPLCLLPQPIVPGLALGMYFCSVFHVDNDLDDSQEHSSIVWERPSEKKNMSHTDKEKTKRH
jgi:hypothetical protein